MTNDEELFEKKAYFVGRAEILDWLNRSLQLRLSKIEETASGAVACQVFDMLFPNIVQMSRVNWGARSEWEFVANYKVLQAACDKLGVDKRIDVDRLIKARYQDNLEFLQWLKKFFDDNSTGISPDYDPIARRAIGKGATGVKWIKTSATTGGSAGSTTTVSPPKPATQAATIRPTSTRTTAPVSPPNLARVSPPRAGTRSAVSSLQAGPIATATSAKKETATARATAAAVAEKESTLMQEHTAVVSSIRAELDSYKKQLDAHKSESAERVSRLEQQLKQCEVERDFYLSKLKNVELALQALPEDQDGRLVRSTISHILYDEPAEELSGLGDGMGDQQATFEKDDNEQLRSEGF